MTKRKRIFLGLGFLLTCAAAWFGWQVYYFFTCGIDNAYAQWGAGNMVVCFMEKHEGRWPGSWEDLRPYYPEQSMIGGWPFEKFCRRIRVDWKADPAALRQAALANDHPTFNVISPAHGGDVRWEGRSGNQIVYQYFRRKMPSMP